MCIRDSSAHKPKISSSKDAEKVLRENWSDDIELLEECNVPVSYTHLRAHETVLDLVCRLLLEKTTILGTDL